MGFWAAFPFLRYVLWLIGGIVAAHYSSLGSAESWWVLTLLLALCYALWYFIMKAKAPFKTGQGILACVVLFSAGFARMEERKENLQPTHLQEDAAYWLVEVEGEGVPTDKTVKVPVRLLAKKGGGGWLEARGKALFYIRKEENYLFQPAQGSQLLVKATVNAVPPPLNPSVFNYKSYLEVQGICCQAFLTADQLQLVQSAEPGFFLQGFAGEIRGWALQQVDEYVKGKQETAIVNSLVLGWREALDQELLQAYSTAGTMHVLAVSGLHVGFIYLFLKFLFGSWRRHPQLKWLSYIAVLLVLWGYALITGLSPSVLRAVFMFSLVDAALLLKRKTSIYNSLGLAALVLLMWNPKMLWMVGFQLSFLAVFGIVYLQPRISAWYTPGNKLLRKGWNLLAVSLAAQFATFPLGLYYFGQFPTYFFITNLLVVPAAFLVLAGGFGVLLFSLFSDFLADLSGEFLYYLVKGINWIVFTAEAFPYSRLTIQLSAIQLWILLAGLASLLLFFHFRRFPSFLPGFLFLSMLFASFTYRTFQQKEQRKLMVYHIPGYSLLQLVEGRKEFFMADEGLPPSQLQYQVQPYRKVLGIAPAKEEPVLANAFQPAFREIAGNKLLVWRGLKVLKVEAELPDPCWQQRAVEVDYILLTHNAVKDLNKLSCYFSGGTLLIDGSNRAFLQKKLVRQAESLNLPYHLTAEAGAFELNL